MRISKHQGQEKVILWLSQELVKKLKDDAQTVGLDIHELADQYIELGMDFGNSERFDELKKSVKPYLCKIDCKNFKRGAISGD